jgi:hypothetical protein
MMVGHKRIAIVMTLLAFAFIASILVATAR